MYSMPHRSRRQKPKIPSFPPRIRCNAIAVDPSAGGTNLKHARPQPRAQNPTARKRGGRPAEDAIAKQIATIQPSHGEFVVRDPSVLKSNRYRSIQHIRKKSDPAKKKKKTDRVTQSTTDRNRGTRPTNPTTIARRGKGADV